jgi:hypothetical protein
MALGLVAYTKYTSVMRLVLKCERNPCWYEADPELLRTKSGRPPTLTEKMREGYVTEEVVGRGGRSVHGGKAAKYVEAKRREGLQFRVEHADVSTKLGRANRLGALKSLAGKGSVQTAEVHVAMMSLDSRVKVIRKAMDKSGPRYLGEHSLFGALNTAIRTTYVCFRPLDRGEVRLPQGFSQEVMEAFTGVPMTMKDPRNIFNLDATTWHPHRDPLTGVVSSMSGVRLVAADWGGESTAAFKDPSESVGRFGNMSLKMYWCGNLSGTQTPIFIVKYVTVDELPVAVAPSGVLPVPLLWLLPSTALVGGTAPHGHVVFVRRGEGAGETLMLYWYEHVYLPTVAAVRKSVDGYVHLTGQPVPGHHKGVLMMDGDNDQIKVVLGPLRDRLIDLDLDHTKGDPAASGVNQFADKQVGFREVKTSGRLPVVPSTTSRSLEQEAMHAIPTAGVELSRADLVDLSKMLSAIPSVVQKSFSAAKVQKGGVECGYLDDATRSHLVFRKMLDTCRRPWLPEENRVVEDIPTLVSLCKEIQANDFICDETFENLHHVSGFLTGIRLDCNEHGEEFARDAAVTAIGRMRGCRLTGRNIMQLIKDVKAQKDEAARVNKAKTDAKFAKAKEDLASFYRKVHAKLTRPTTDGGSGLKPPIRGSGCGIGQPRWLVWASVNLEAKHIWGRDASCPKGQELDAFVRSRTSDIWPTPGYSASKKGNEADYKAGKACLVKQTMAMLPKPNLWGHEHDSSNNESDGENGGGVACAQVAEPARAVAAAAWNPGNQTTLVPSAAEGRWKWNVPAFYAAVSNLFGEGRAVQVDLDVADYITKVVHSRLEKELPARLADRGRSSHWAFQWFRANVWAFVVVLLALGKLKTRVQFVREDGCYVLLPSQWLNDAVAATSCPWAGAYVHVAAIDSYLCRVGKASGDGGIAQRQEGHAKGSKLQDSASVTSNFYCHWPWDGKGVNGIEPRGRFQDLDAYVLAAFDHREPAVVEAITSDKNVLWLDWSVGKDEVRRSSSGGSTVSARRVALVSYGLELTGDLLLSADHNESSAPGLETFTGDLGKA